MRTREIIEAVRDGLLSGVTLRDTLLSIDADPLCKMQAVTAIRQFAPDTTLWDSHLESTAARVGELLEILD